MKTTSLIITFLFGLTVLALNQVSPTKQTMSRLNAGNAVGFDNRYQGLKGSPYIMKEWYGAILYPSGQPALKVEHLNFDRHTLELCYRETADGVTQLINKYLIDSFALVTPRDSFKFKKVKFPGTSDFVFLEKLGPSSVNLFLDHAKRFIEADYEEVYSADRRYDEFKDEPAFYIRLELDGDLYKVTRNRKQMASLFGMHKDRMLQFFKSEKVNFSEQDDLISMMKFYGEIVE